MGKYCATFGGNPTLSPVRFCLVHQLFLAISTVHRLDAVALSAKASADPMVLVTPALAAMILSLAPYATCPGLCLRMDVNL
jgi:hypothetical protein